jgi:hypothetical protein
MVGWIGGLWLADEREIAARCQEDKDESDKSYVMDLVGRPLEMELIVSLRLLLER